MEENNNVVSETVEPSVATTPNGNPVQVVKKDSFIKKTGRFIKKHGKKILVGVGITAAGALGYVLGSRQSNDDRSCDDTDGADEVIYDDVIDNYEENGNN